jgi:hypothetical protein
MQNKAKRRRLGAVAWCGLSAEVFSQSTRASEPEAHRLMDATIQWIGVHTLDHRNAQRHVLE